jgi:hypothetical protein
LTDRNAKAPAVDVRQQMIARGGNSRRVGHPLRAQRDQEKFKPL